jgi:hypothetical protein
VKELHQPEEVIRKRGTGKFKELLLREEPRQGGLVARLWSGPVRLRSIYGPFTVRFRFVFGSSSALLARRYWSSVWVVVLRYIGALVCR